jgi:hypothetical protein
MSKLVLLGTYWNESEWIDRSLSQIVSISPDLSILCDGCFDDRKENFSTDGTKKIIDAFCDGSNKFIKFSAYRGTRVESVLKLLHFGLKQKFSFAYIYWVFKHAIKTDKYRLNQAVTFNQMLHVAVKKLGTDIWFMTYDADQFYDDSYVNILKDIINSNSNSCSLLSAKELTFNNDCNHYTDMYETRTWNNLPHKYYINTVILPTRDIKVSELFKLTSYINLGDNIDLGFYFHYKYREDKIRHKMTYSLGDRKPPSHDRIDNEVFFDGKHPKVISKL